MSDENERCLTVISCSAYIAKIIYYLHVCTLLASQSSIIVWSLLNGCKLQTIPVLVNDHYQQSPVMCYTNNFSGAGPYTSALITNVGGSLTAFSFRNF